MKRLFLSLLTGALLVSSAVSFAQGQSYSNPVSLINTGTTTTTPSPATTTQPPPPPPPFDTTLTPGVSPITVTDTPNSGPVDSLADQQDVLRSQMRKLWSDHIFWTRQYIVSSVANLPDAQAISDRLMKNQEDIGAAFKIYYSEDVGNRLTDLLKQHISSAVDLVASLKASDSAKFNAAKTKAQQNIQDLATYLNQQDASMNKDELVKMFSQHVQGLIDETNRRLNQQWAEDVTNFDVLYNQALMMADAMANGLIKKFPDKFQPVAVDVSPVVPLPATP